MSQYRFTKDFTNYKKGDLMNDITTHFNPFETALMLHTGILEEVKEDEWPKVGGDYWFIDSDGDVWGSHWDGEVTDEYRQAFLGIYRTKEEAEKARDDVREFIRNRNKSND